MVFSIDSENNIRILDAVPPDGSAAPDGTLIFDSSRAFTHAALEWPMARFTAIWEKLAPRVRLKAVRSFNNRQDAMVRIWRAVARLAGGCHGGAAEETDQSARQAKSRKREGTTKAKVVALLERDGGATIQDIQNATGWQPHTVRGFLSTLPYKCGPRVTSSKRQDGTRVYQVAR